MQAGQLMTPEPNPYDTGAPTMRWKVKKKRIPGNLKLDRRDCLRTSRRDWHSRLSSDLNAHKVLHIDMQMLASTHRAALVLFPAAVLTIKCYVLQPNNLHLSL